MKVLVLVNGELKEGKVQNTYEDFRQIVGGNIEIPPLSEDFISNNIDTIIYGECKDMDDSELSLIICSRKTGKCVDYINGKIIFANYDNGKYMDITEEQKEIIKNQIKQKAIYKKKIVRVLWIPESVWD